MHPLTTQGERYTDARLALYARTIPVRFDALVLRSACQRDMIVLRRRLDQEPKMPAPNVKEETRRLAERLPEHATWEDVQYEIYVRQAIEAGMKDSAERRTVPLAEARRRFGLPSE